MISDINVPKKDWKQNDLIRGVWNTLQGLADWIGLGQYVKDANLSMHGMPSEEDVSSLVNRIVAKATEVGQDKLDILYGKMSGILSKTSSPTIKNALDKLLSQTSQDIKKQKLLNTKNQIDISDAQDALNSYRNSRSGDYKKQESALNKIKNIGDKYETNISE